MHVVFVCENTELYMDQVPLKQITALLYYHTLTFD